MFERTRAIQCRLDVCMLPIFAFVISPSPSCVVCNFTLACVRLLACLYAVCFDVCSCSRDS